MITSLNQLDFDKKYTYTDYLLWKFKERVELLQGRLFPMAAPNAEHQLISSNLHGMLWSHLRNSTCNVYSAPFDVRLPLPPYRTADGKIDTVVQPDLCVICDLSKIDKQGCVGPPDLVVEILSPGNAQREMKEKFELYEQAGVLEYWIFMPNYQTALTYHLDENTGAFVADERPLTIEDTLESRVFGELKIELSKVLPPDTATE